MSSTAAPLAPAAERTWWRALTRRELHTYPATASRLGYLALTVLITIALYYMAYCGGSVATLQMADLHISFNFAVYVAAVGNVLGAASAYFAGITDRIGRATAVIAGVGAVSVITLFAIPNSPNRWVFTVLTHLVGLIEGVVLVATPALIRDFSPQTNRARAMGFWTLGPVVGLLIASLVGTWTIHGTPSAGFWSHEYLIAGAAGLAVSVLAALFLRELAPELRDQLMVSEADRALIEARAKGIDVEESTRHRFRQMLKADIILSGFAVSVLLLAFYTAVALAVILFQVVFGFSLHQANALGNWMWGINALAVVSVGIVSDRLRVRKPFMVAGALISAVFLVLYLERFGHHTSFAMVALLVSGISFGMGVAYTPWMASFTETIEARNPALIATGLGVWGLTLRVVIFVMLILAPIVITTVTPLVNFVVRTTPYTATLQFAGSHPALIAQVTNPQNSAQLASLASLAKTNPTELAAVQADSASLQTLTQYAPEVSAIAAHPQVFVQLAAKPTDATLQAQAVAALGGGATGTTRLATLVAHQTAISSALTYAQAHPAVIAFAETHAATLTWAAQHASLVAQATQYAPELTALTHIPPKVLAYAATHSAGATKAQELIPSQVRTWYWICFAGPVIFLLCVPLLKGRWSPRRARRDFEAYEAAVQAELARLQGASTEVAVKA